MFRAAESWGPWMRPRQGAAWLGAAWSCTAQGHVEKRLSRQNAHRRDPGTTATLPW